MCFTCAVSLVWRQWKSPADRNQFRFFYEICTIMSIRFSAVVCLSEQQQLSDCWVFLVCADSRFSSLWSTLSHAQAAHIHCIIKHLVLIWLGEVQPADSLSVDIFTSSHIGKLISNILFILDSGPVGLVAATAPCQRQTDSIRFTKRWQPNDTVSPDKPETSNYTGSSRFSCGASSVLLRSCFGPRLGSGGLLEGENMGTSGGSRQALALHHGRTSAWKLHYVPAVGLAVALSKNNFWQDDVFWQVQRGVLQAWLLQEEEHEEEVLAIIIMWGGLFLGVFFQYELACVHWWPGFDGRFR